METGLHLMLPDGPVHVSFSPRLTIDQYAELNRVIDRATTKHELRVLLEVTATLWERDWKLSEALGAVG